MIVTVTTKGKIRPRRFRGIVAVSRELGLSRLHVYMVLTGQRESKVLERRLTEMGIKVPKRRHARLRNQEGAQ